ncbi:hypothetical protein GBAR_LOCUS20249 [Geodia barretti]|uniref:Uncharacterized protein n=1 Tax=Geodia barretti TaxID=519541 RepID=A0AA35SUS8_GEOBA|nr:hypothetical protein GBAR_LOCUS20249 [Geodia barretti]
MYVHRYHSIVHSGPYVCMYIGRYHSISTRGPNVYIGALA